MEKYRQKPFRAFLHKGDLQLQYSDLVFISGKFSQCAYKIIFSVHGNCAQGSLAEAYRQSMGLFPFQKGHRENSRFTGERNLLDALCHIIMEDLHKQWKQANALLTHFLGPAVELLPEFLEESRRVGFFTTAVISAQLTFFPAPTQNRADQLHSLLQFSAQPLQ